MIASYKFKKELITVLILFCIKVQMAILFPAIHTTIK